MHLRVPGKTDSAASHVAKVLVMAAIAVWCVGCRTKAKPWREQRTVGPHFKLVEWMRGTKERIVPVGSDIEGDRPEFHDRQPGLVGWMQDLESGKADGTKAPAAAPPFGGEPHGFTVELTRAKVCVKTDKLRLVKEYKGDVRFWPSPDGMKLLQQKVSRDRPIEIIDNKGEVKPLHEKAVLGLPPTFSKYPLAFIAWAPDSRSIVALSVHTAEARGYVFLAKWRVDAVRGNRTLIEERLLLLSSEVSDWRLVAIPKRASAKQVRPLLQELARSKDTWVRRAALGALYRVNRRALHEK